MSRKTISYPGLQRVRRSHRENNVDSLNPEFWAREALLQLEGELILPNLPYIDFKDEVGTWGGVVNINRLPAMQARRKGRKCESITQSDTDSESFQLELNQYLYQSFLICDGDEDRGSRDLLETFLAPAVTSVVELMENIVGAQHINFWDQWAGHLGGLSSTTAEDYLLEVSEKMSLNKIPQAGRSIILGPASETPFKKVDKFSKVNESGSTQTLRNGIIGRLDGIDTYGAFGVPSVNPGSLTMSTAQVNNSSGYNAGATTIAHNNDTATPVAGQWLKIAGDDVPQQVISATTSSMVISPGLRRPVVDDAAISWVKAGALVNTGTTYAGPSTNPKVYGYAKNITLDGCTDTPPQVGQFVSFGTSTVVYGIVSVTAGATADDFDIWLDRPLEAALTNNTTVNLGLPGKYNLAFGKNAIAMAIRPLPKPRPNTGVTSAVINHKGYSFRVTIGYNMDKQAHQVNIDTLFGIGVYRDDQAVVMFG